MDGAGACERREDECVFLDVQCRGLGRDVKKGNGCFAMSR
jgi:hypothetical protein